MVIPESTPNQPHSLQNPLKEYLYYPEIPLHYPNLITPNAIQWMVRNRECNGLEPHILRVGRRLFVHLPSFSEWLESQRGVTDRPAGGRVNPFAHKKNSQDG